MNTIAVYSVIVGDYDPYIEPDVPGCDLFLYTDRKPKHAPRRASVVMINESLPDLTRLSRLYKVMSHVGPVGAYRHVLYVDGAVDMVDVDVPELVDRYLKSNDLAVFRHQVTDCVYVGAQMVLLCHKDDPAVVEKHLSRLKAAGHPEHGGLGEPGVLLRTHCDEIREFNTRWWQEIEGGSRRDMLSFNFCLDTMKVRMAYIDGKRQDHGFFVREHR